MNINEFKKFAEELVEENKRLKEERDALIAGQETLQRYLATIEANGISVEKYKDSINCLEKACDELKKALKKKDYELKAVRHYYNECLKDLKKAHAEIKILKKNPPSFILTNDESFASLTQKLPKLNPLVMSSDNASIVCIDADKIKAEAIKEFAELSIKRLCENVTAPTPTESYIVERCNQELDNLVKEMVGEG